MSKFKAGDWIRNTWLGIIKQYSYRDKDYDEKYDGTENESKHWELWQPEVGEWCWFWNRDDYTPIVGKLSSHSIEEQLYFNFNGVVDYSYENCEPFIGELPSFLKDT